VNVDVVIPVHGNWELTEQCLDTLPREAPIERVFVVDDGSPDDTAERLARRSDVVPIVLDGNRGFAGACNAGASRSRADAILFLNNDTIVPQGAIAKLAAELDADPTIGAIGPRLLYADGTIQSAGIALLNIRQTTRLYLHLDGTLPQANRSRDDLLLTGAALLVRRDVFASIGGFDEAFHNGVEDCDLSLRIWAHGYRCRYEPAAAVVHMEGASRGKKPNDEANFGLFEARWGMVLHDFPLLAWEDPPVVGLRWQARDGLDRLVRDRIMSMLKRFGGARRALVKNALDELTLRVLAHFDRRAMIQVAYGEGPADVRVVTPRGVDVPRERDAPAGTRYWVPSAHARTALIERGVPAESVSTFHLGANAEPRSTPAQLDETVLLVVDRERTKDADVERIVRGLDRVPIRIVSYADATPGDLVTVRNAGLVVAIDEDPWGLFVGEALAGGAVVVAPPTAPPLEIFPSAAFVAVDEPATFADVLAEVRAHFDDYAPRGARASREVQRRVDALDAGERLRELTRAAAHGVPEADAVAVTPEVAASLRR
jgi:GT2 family glycosyltransferase